MTRSAALLLVFAAVALSAASARIAPEDVNLSEDLLGRQLLGKQECKNKDGCEWCPDEGGKKEHDGDYECQPATYILGSLTSGLGGLLGGGKNKNKWCRRKEPKEPKCDDGWFYSKSEASDCKCLRKDRGFCCHAEPEPEPDCEDMPGDYAWFYSPKQEDNCKCKHKGKGFCCYKEPEPLPDCKDMPRGHKWFYSPDEKDNCMCESKGPGYCCYEKPEPLPDCKDMPRGHKWFYSPDENDNCVCESKGPGYCCYEKPVLPDCSKQTPDKYEWFPSFEEEDNCKCVSKGDGYCCYKPKPPPSCRQLYGSKYSADSKGSRSGYSCKPDAKKTGYCCKKVEAPKPRCIKHWYYGKNRNFCEDSNPDKNKFCFVFKIGGKKLRCCAKKEKGDYDDDKCFYKSVNKKMRKCCYDSSSRKKNDRKFSCFRSEHKGKRGNFCYDKNTAY